MSLLSLLQSKSYDDIIYKINIGLLTELDTLLLLCIQVSVDIPIEISFLEFLHSKGANFNLVDDDGNTLLFLCENPIIMKYLLTKNINIHHRNSTHDTAFLHHVQAETDYDSLFKMFDILTLLLENGAYINDQNRTKNALLYSVDYEVLKFLISKGIDINLQNIQGLTILMKVCRGLNVKKLKLLMTIPEINVNLQDQNGKTALHHIMTEGLRNSPDLLFSTLELLLENSNVDVNLRNNEGFPAFSLLCNIYNYPENFNEICKLFLRGINFNEQIEFLGNNTYLDFCVSNNGLRIYNIEFLLENGATPTFRSCAHSIFRNYIDYIKLMFKYGMNINETDVNGRTLLFYVNNIEMFDLLLKYGANINYVNTQTEGPIKTALDQYADLPHTDLVLYAISKGAKITNYVRQEIHHPYISMIQNIDSLNDVELQSLFELDHCFWIRVAFNHSKEKKIYYKLIKIYQNYLNLPEDTIYNIVNFECF